jgi:excisionase family DNA binding protein
MDGSKDTPLSPRLLTIEGAADFLGVSVRHVRRLVAGRRVPYVKWGSRLHFDPEELDAWIDRHRIPEVNR